MRVVLHKQADTEHTAVLLALLTQAGSLGQKIPGIKFPIHVSVEFDGKTACGAVAPSGMPAEECN